MMMETLSDPAFWGEVGLACAGRLALLAAVVWVARVVGHPRVSDRAAVTVPAAVADATAEPEKRQERSHEHNNRLPNASARYVNLRSRLPESRVSEAASSRTEAPSAKANPVRDRLMEYVRQQTTEGIGA